MLPHEEIMKDTTSIIPAHDLASWLLSNIDRMFDFIGLSHHKSLEQIIYFAIIVLVSLAIGWLIKKILLVISRKAVKLQNTELGREILKRHTLSKCSHFIPPLVFVSLAPFAFDSSSELLSIIIRISWAYIVICFAVGITAILDLVFSRYNAKENTRNLPIKGILNVAKGIVWGIAAIIAIAIIVHRSPAALLGGLGAFAAALMLIFKDSILGFVSGIQMSQNDMLHVGDWIVVPNTPANGTVLDVSLTTVKVQNFDNTIVMVPPYTLVSTSFQNWRGMTDSGVRRVMMNIYVNPDTVRFATDEMLQKLSDKYPALQKFISGLKDKQQTVACDTGLAPVNGTIETNLGLYRAYVVSYLLANQHVDPSYDLMVSMQPMSPEGIPMQIYCFSRINQWEGYEAVKAAIMEHALCASADFGLEILSGDHLNVDTNNVEVYPVDPNNPAKLMAQSNANSGKASSDDASPNDKGTKDATSDAKA